MYAIADRTKGKDGATVYYDQTGPSFTPHKMWKTLNGARRGLDALIRRLPSSAAKLLVVVEVE